MPNLRILLYTHNGLAMGHLTRQAAIAQQIKILQPDASVMIISGAQLGFEQIIPKTVEYIKLPSMKASIEQGDYVYQPARLTMPFDEVLEMRKAILRATIESYHPHIVLVDHNPSGLRQELKEIIIETVDRREKRFPIFLLGLRDIINDPETSNRFLLKPRNLRLLNDYYESILIYGDPLVLDMAAEYQLPPAVAQKLNYFGYIFPRQPVDPALLDRVRSRLNLEPGEKLVFIAAGGGKDGFPVLRAALEACTGLQAEYPIRFYATTGPYMDEKDRAQLNALAANQRGIQITAYEPDFLAVAQLASLFIGRCGYNTALEVLSCAAPTIFIPREIPEREQLERAERFARLGWCQCVREHELADGKLAIAIREILSGQRAFLPLELPLDGAQQAAQWIISRAKTALECSIE